MSEEQVKQEEQQDPSVQLPQLLQGFSNAPSLAQIEEWKVKYGEVFVSGFSDTELFVWRPVSRPEYVKIQEMAQNPQSALNQYQLEEILCDTCVLWKSVSRSWDQGKAGTPQTLADQIMQNSNFLSPAAASMLVAKL